MVFTVAEKTPQIDTSAFIAPTAVVIGDVVLGAQASVWYGAVVRGDSGRIVVGARTSVQDNVVLHVNDRDDTLIGADVTIGHGAVLEGCVVGDGCLIGMNATVLSGARLGKNCLVAAGAVVREGTIVSDGLLVAGVPAVVKGRVSAELRTRIAQASPHYVQNSSIHRTTLHQVASNSADQIASSSASGGTGAEA